MTTQALITRIKALRELAEKATPGQWISDRQDEEDGRIYWAVHSMIGYEFICNLYSNAWDAHHVITCNPAAMIELYDELLKVLEGR